VPGSGGTREGPDLTVGPLLSWLWIR